MEKASSLTDFHVNIIERVVVAPCLPSPKTVLHFSAADKIARLFSDVLFVYSASDGVSADPAKTIREALSKVLVYYYPFAGRLRSKENEELELDCKGQGALFVEAMADNDLSVLRDLDDYNPSFQQLLYSLPEDTHLQDLHLLIIQVTRFTCGGFVLGANLYGSICDGKGFGQFIKGMAEMARGELKPSIEPIWDRALVKHEDYVRLQLYQSEIIHAPLIKERLHQASLVINLETIKCIKRCIVEECKENFSTFEIVAALVWLAKIKASRIPHNENVKLFIAMDMRKSLNPPLPKGYYGNAFGIACVVDNVQDLLSGSLLHAILIINKTKLSFHKNLNSSITMNPSALDANMKLENMISISDWRQSGYYEADFGWGDAMNVSIVQQQWEHELAIPTNFIFLRTTKNMPDGIKILMFIPLSMIKPFKIEMEAMIKKNVTKMCRSKL